MLSGLYTQIALYLIKSKFLKFPKRFLPASSSITAPQNHFIFFHFFFPCKSMQSMRELQVWKLFRHSLSLRKIFVFTLIHLSCFSPKAFRTTCHDAQWSYTFQKKQEPRKLRTEGLGPGLNPQALRRGSTIHTCSPMTHVGMGGGASACTSKEILEQ